MKYVNGLTDRLFSPVYIFHAIIFKEENIVNRSFIVKVVHKCFQKKTIMKVHVLDGAFYFSLPAFYTLLLLWELPYFC